MVNYAITALGYGNNLEFGEFSKISARLKQRGVPESILFVQDTVQEDVGISGLNVIDHRKFMIIDGLTSIIDSLNIGDQYTYETSLKASSIAHIDGQLLGIPSKVEEWHDGCFRIRGAAALPLNVVFQSRWILLGGDHFEADEPFYHPDVNYDCGEEECMLFVRFPGNPVNLMQQYYLDLITYAAEETIIVNSYLIDPAFWDRLGELGPECSGHLSICNPLQVNDHPTNRAAVRGNM